MTQTNIQQQAETFLADRMQSAEIQGQLHEIDTQACRIIRGLLEELREQEQKSVAYNTRDVIELV